jgi:hypothetical protein
VGLLYLHASGANQDHERNGLCPQKNLTGKKKSKKAKGKEINKGKKKKQES